MFRNHYTSRLHVAFGWLAAASQRGAVALRTRQAAAGLADGEDVPGANLCGWLFFRLAVKSSF